MIQQEQPCGAFGFIKVGGGENDGCPLRSSGRDQAPQFCPADGVHARSWFIKQHQAGLVQCCKHHPEFLPHPAREPPSQPVGYVV